MMNISLILLVLMAFLAEIATDIYVPSLPLLGEFFGVNLETVNLTMSLHLIGFAIGQPVYGPLSDRYGRKRVFICGNIIFIIASFLCALSTHVTTLIVARFLQGIGACVAPVIGLAIVRDIFHDSKQNIQAISLMSMTTALSPIIGPIIGTFIAEYFGWSGNFYLIGFSATVVTGLLFINLESDSSGLLNKAYDFKEALAFYRLPFILYVLTNAFVVACVWVFITAAPFILMQKFDVPLLQYGFYQAATVVAYIAGGLTINRLVKVFSIEKLSKVGFLVISLGSSILFGVWLFDAFTPYSFIFAVSCYGFGVGVFRPTVVNAVMNFNPQQSGTASAILGTTEMLVSAGAIAILGYSQESIIGVTVAIFVGFTMLSGVLRLRINTS